MMQHPIFSIPGLLQLAVWTLALPMCVVGQGLLATSADDASVDSAVLTAEPGINSSDFPPLPPDPYEHDKQPLDALEDELWFHGGSYLYEPEGDGHHGSALEGAGDVERLRLPSSWQAPQPFTAFADFLGADPIVAGKRRRHGGYSLEPRFVAYGGYELFGAALEQANRDLGLVGHNLRVDLDLRLTGTERFHVQFRPFGERNTGGSFYQFGDEEGYIDNSTGEPDRYWFEGELHSFRGFDRDPFAQQYLNFMAGKFPFLLHNGLLMNDEIIGGVVSQNNLRFAGLSNLNLQWFVGANDVDTYRNVESRVYGLHASADLKRVFYEATYAYNDSESDRSAHYVGLSRTKFCGPLTIALRGLVKLGDRGGTGSAHLLAAESNYNRVFASEPLGIEHAVFFCNAFWAESGWNSLGGTNFNRLRTAFQVDPLLRAATLPTLEETVGATLGVQLFRRHEDESCVPEFAWESRGGDTVFGLGIRYLRKTGRRTFLEVLGVTNWSSNDSYDRNGISITHTYLF